MATDAKPAPVQVCPLRLFFEGCEMTDRDLMQQALDALENAWLGLTDEKIIEWVESGEYNVITNDWQSHIEFARAVERETGVDKAELWLKRINEAVLAEREACAKVCEPWLGRYPAIEIMNAIRARGQA
jgi:hypothetical protein